MFFAPLSECTYVICSGRKWGMGSKPLGVLQNIKGSKSTGAVQSHLSQTLVRVCTKEFTLFRAQTEITSDIV